MPDQNKAQCTVRLFALFFKKKSDEISFPEITIHRKTGKEIQPCFERGALDKGSAEALKMLHPQTAKFLNSANSTMEDQDSVVTFHLNQYLRDELRRAIWSFEAPKWALPVLEDVFDKAEPYGFDFKITDISGSLFPTGILFLYLVVEPAFKITDQLAVSAGKILMNALHRSGRIFGDEKVKSVPITRVFHDQRQKDAVVRRFGENTFMGLTMGLCGREVSVGDIFESIAPESDFYSFMGDRFLSNAFIKTNWDGMGEAFEPKDYVELVRLSRGESDHYLPDTSECQPGSKGIVTTFENVAFALSGEGIVCWIKPTDSQRFLQDQFRHKYNTIYLQMYLLALHQRYALVNIANRLERATPSVGLIKGFTRSKDINEIEFYAEKLRELRSEVADFYLRAFFQQPAVLTNHQEYYETLQDVLGVSDLLKEVQQATSELEFIIGSLHERKTERRDKNRTEEQNEQHSKILEKISTLIEEQENAAKNELVLTLVVEGLAIPYYTYSFLSHAFHLPDIFSACIGITLTICTMGYTFIRFRKKLPIRSNKYQNEI